MISILSHIVRCVGSFVALIWHHNRMLQFSYYNSIRFTIRLMTLNENATRTRTQPIWPDWACASDTSNNIKTEYAVHRSP